MIDFIMLLVHAALCSKLYCNLIKHELLHEGEPRFTAVYPLTFTVLFTGIECIKLPLPGK